MKGGLTRRIAAASAVLAFIVAGAFAVLVVAIADERDAADRARHSEEVLAAANHLERLVIDLETGQRGFVITGEERFLDPWNDARQAFPEQARAFERLAAARHAEQGNRARQITAAGMSYIRDYSIPTVEAARQDPASARTVAATEEGKRRVDVLRADFDHFAAVERDLAASRQKSAEAAARRAIAAATAGVAGSVVLVALFTVYLTRAIVRPVRHAAEMAARLAGGDLSVRMPETAPAEIGGLERAFNTMAGSLESSRAELTASRARVVAAADETRRRLERDLHDGAQQRLVSLSLDLRAAEASVPAGLGDLKDHLAHVAKGLTDAVDDLREISRGLHPAVLSRGGLGPALKTLARRSAVPVRLQIGTDRRLPDGVEAAAYYVVSEALTNAAKHARASVVAVDLEVDDTFLRLDIRDDGVGGADPALGSGLVGLKDRVEALGGTIEVTSPAGGGTSLAVKLPVD